MIQIEKPKHFDLFDGMNVHPVPLDFSNSITTLEMLLALQEKVNELVALWGDTIDKIKVYTEEQQQILKNEILEQITSVQNILEEYINNAIAENQNKITEETEARQTADENLRNELLEKITSLETILNLINNGESVSLTELFENYSNINNSFDNLENGFVNIQEDFNKLNAKVKEFTSNIAICKLFEQEEIETPDTLINDNIESLSLTYSSRKIESLIKKINDNLENTKTIIKTIGSTTGENRDTLQSLEESFVANTNEIMDSIDSIIGTTNTNIKQISLYCQKVNATFTNINDMLKGLHPNAGTILLPMLPILNEIKE